MTPEQEREVARICEAALDRPANERATFVVQECAGDELLRCRVESLLALQSRAEAFLAEPALIAAAHHLGSGSGSAMIGRRLGIYQIETLLGAGGMGEVYRARDTRLQRNVAIKILPDIFTSDPQRLARFEREARMLAALNDPHIGAIYGVEESDGIRALILEFVDGDTLADRIARGPLPPTEALRLAGQIAAALDAAHERGIVHRDLKPANIKITPDGVLKVLDFGLAKAVAGETRSDLSRTPMVNLTGTSEAILGTARYMSPEQARGAAVDKRTDIWAFGCVVYEMLTGRVAFAGETNTDVLAAVIEREPDWTALSAPIAPRVLAQLQRCLVKNPARRLRDIGDIALDGDAAELVADAHEVDHRILPRTWNVAIAVCALAATAAVAGSVWRWRASSISTSLITVGPLARLTTDPGLATDPSVSADGRLVAYASNRRNGDNLDIYVQQTTGGTAIRLTDDPADDHEPSISPDGSTVAFRSERAPAGIYMVPALGGGARLVAPKGMAPRFSPDGHFVAFWTGSWLAPRSTGIVRRVFVMPSAGGAPTQLAPNLASIGDPVWAPDGRSLIVFGRAELSGADTDPDWWWVPVNGSTTVRTGIYDRLKTHGISVTATESLPYPHAWTAEGLFFTGDPGTGDARNLWLVAMDQSSGRAAGDPVRLTNGTTMDTGATVANDDRMVFSAQAVTRATFALPLDANAGRPTGALRRVNGDIAATGRTSISEDGHLLVLPKYAFDTGGIWVRNLETGVERQLAATSRTPLNPVMSVDGRWIGYTVTKKETGGNAGPGDGFIVATSGSAPQKVCDRCYIDAWTRDDRFVVIRDDVQDPKGWSLTRVDIATGHSLPFLSGSVGPLDRPMFGPNGRWATFNSPGAVYLASVHADRVSAESEWTKIVDTRGTSGRTAGMSPDGTLLYLLLERDGFRCLYALRLDPANGSPRGEPFLVAHFHDATRRWGSTGLGSAVAHGIFLADLFETTGNLWMTTLRH